jgi:hypothetical protein
MKSCLGIASVQLSLVCLIQYAGCSVDRFFQVIVTGSNITDTMIIENN